MSELQAALARRQKINDDAPQRSRDEELQALDDVAAEEEPRRNEIATQSLELQAVLARRLSIIDDAPQRSDEELQTLDNKVAEERRQNDIATQSRELQAALARRQSIIDDAPQLSRNEELQTLEDKVAEDERRRNEIITQSRSDSERRLQQEYQEALRALNDQADEEERHRVDIANANQRTHEGYLERAEARMARHNADDDRQRRLKEFVRSDPGRNNGSWIDKHEASEQRRGEREFLAIVYGSDSGTQYIAPSTTHDGQCELQELGSFTQRHANLSTIREQLSLQLTQAEQRHFQRLAARHPASQSEDGETIDSNLSMPSRKVPHEAIGEVCPICHDELVEGDHVAVMPCRHFCFHHTCIATWLQGHSTCPLCRQEVSCALTAFVR